MSESASYTFGFEGAKGLGGVTLVPNSAVQLRFWRQLQVVTFALIGGYYIFVAFALAELAGVKSVNVATWTMSLSFPVFFNVIGLVYTYSLAMRHGHASPRENPLVELMLYTLVAYGTVMLPASLFHLRYSDEAEKLDARDNFDRPLQSVLDPRYHAVWLCIMVLCVTAGSQLLMAVVPVFRHQQLPRFYQRVAARAGGTPGDMIQAVEHLARQSTDASLDGVTNIVVKSAPRAQAVAASDPVGNVRRLEQRGGSSFVM